MLQCYGGRGGTDGAERTGRNGWDETGRSACTGLLLTDEQSRRVMLPIAARNSWPRGAGGSAYCSQVSSVFRLTGRLTPGQELGWLQLLLLRLRRAKKSTAAHDVVYIPLAHAPRIAFTATSIRSSFHNHKPGGIASPSLQQATCRDHSAPSPSCARCCWRRAQFRPHAPCKLRLAL